MIRRALAESPTLAAAQAKLREAQETSLSFIRYAGLSEEINAFWLERRNRESGGWTGHRTINMVMLATSLAPDGYLSLP